MECGSELPLFFPTLNFPSSTNESGAPFGINHLRIANLLTPLFLYSCKMPGV
jgi:hypothetical protein